MIIFWKNLDTGSLNVPADVWAHEPIEDLDTWQGNRVISIIIGSARLKGSLVTMTVLLIAARLR